jgi:hypothetical protein
MDFILRGDNWWKEVWSFYVGLSGKPREITNWVLVQITRNPGTRYKKTPQAHIDDVFKPILDSFPEFPLDEVASYQLNELGYSLDLDRLKKADTNSSVR